MRGCRRESCCASSRHSCDETAGNSGFWWNRLNRLRKKEPPPFCHSERSEESLFHFLDLNRGEIPRSARNDKINDIFRRLFSLWGFDLAGTKTHRLKPALLKASILVQALFLSET